jgi:hypothetical protein
VIEVQMIMPICRVVVDVNTARASHLADEPDH